MTETGCQQCKENTFSGDGASSCTSCPDGTISAAGSALCNTHSTTNTNTDNTKNTATKPKNRKKKPKQKGVPNRGPSTQKTGKNSYETYSTTKFSVKRKFDA